MRFGHTAIIYFAGLGVIEIFGKYFALLEQASYQIIPPYFTLFDLAVIILCIIGFVVWKIKSKDDSEKPIFIKPIPYDEKAHLQTLNVIYQKLSERRLWETGDNTWIIQVPNNYEEVKENARPLEMAGVYSTRPIQMTIIANLEPDLTRALKHLEQHEEYKNLVESWHKLENKIKQYNKNIPSFVKFLENHIRKTMAEKTNYKERTIDNPDRGYNTSDIRKALMLLLYFNLSKPESLSGIFNLRLSKVYNTHVIFEAGEQAYHLIQVPQEDPEPDYNQIRDLLFSIVKDETVLKKYKPHHNRYEETLSANTEFKNNMKPLIDNIENHGFAVTGICDLGY